MPAEGVEIARAKLLSNAKGFRRRASHWDAPEIQFQTDRINHSVSYSDFNGKHTNQVESYFSRLRRMVGGQHHFVSHKYLYQYATRAAWLEDHRRRSKGVNASAILGCALTHPVSRLGEHESREQPGHHCIQCVLTLLSQWRIWNWHGRSTNQSSKMTIATVLRNRQNTLEDRS